MSAKDPSIYQILAEAPRFSAYRDLASELLAYNKAQLLVVDSPNDLYSGLEHLPSEANRVIVYVASTFDASKNPYNLSCAIRKATPEQVTALTLISLDLGDSKHFDDGLLRNFDSEKGPTGKWGRVGLEAMIKKHCADFAHPRFLKS